jgi:hypothetical protein
LLLTKHITVEQQVFRELEAMALESFTRLNESTPGWTLKGEGSRVCREYLAYNVMQHTILT